MQNRHPRMKLSHEEEIFLRHWIYDEVHFREGTGLAKRLQVANKIPPANIAEIIAAALTEPGEQGLPPPVRRPRNRRFGRGLRTAAHAVLRKLDGYWACPGADGPG